MTDSTYRDGVLNGRTRSYCNNGVVEEEGVYRDSERDGAWIWRYCSGNIMQTSTYAAGDGSRMEGVRRVWPGARCRREARREDAVVRGPCSSNVATALPQPAGAIALGPD